MALSGARNITVEDIAYQWKARWHSPHRYQGWSPKSVNLVVLSPSGAMLTTQFFSKNWLDEHERDPENARTHQAAFSPKDVRNAIEAALKAGWSPNSRAKKPFVLDPAPNGKDYGPPDAPRNLNPEHYGPCSHGVRANDYCSDCAYFREELLRIRVEIAARTPPVMPEKEFCIVCFKRHGSLYTHEVGEKLPERFKDSPWKTVRYVVDEREGFAVVCSSDCEGRFYDLVRQDVPNLYERIFASLVDESVDTF
jgi:hypothetical protein